MRQTKYEKAFPWYEVLCVDCYRAIMLADLGRDAEGHAPRSLFKILCRPCLDAFRVWCDREELKNERTEY
jgi:hypothetical protein